MGLFKKKDKKENTIADIEEAKTEIENDKEALFEKPEEKTNDYGLSDDVSNAIDKIIPVISNGDLNLIPSVYKSDVLAEAVNDAELSDILVLARYTSEFIKKDEKGDKGFGATFMNILAGGIAEKIKNADKLYTIYSGLLRNPYPLISLGYALIFFDGEEAEAWAKEYSAAHGNEVYVKELNGQDEIKKFFADLTCMGIINIGVEPSKSMLVMNHAPLYGIKFETVSDPNVQYLSLRFIQINNSKIFNKDSKSMHGALLSTIINSKYIVPGKVTNNRFAAVLLNNQDKSFVTVYTDKRELGEAMLQNENAKKFLQSADYSNLSFAELEPFLTSSNVNALVINMAGVGFTIPKEIYVNLFKAIKENPGKKVNINVE